MARVTWARSPLSLVMNIKGFKSDCMQLLVSNSKATKMTSAIFNVRSVFDIEGLMFHVLWQSEFSLF